MDNEDTGFAAGVYHDHISGKNILAFQGTDATSWDDWYNNIQQGLGNAPEQYKTATRIANELEHWRKGSVDTLITSTAPSAWVITGHSLGGGLASAASMVSDVRAATFNAAGLHPNSLEPYLWLSDEAMHSQGEDLITAYVVDWDILNNLQDAGDITIDILVNVPTAVGDRVTLDSDLDIEMANGVFKVLVGGVISVLGGSGVGTTISGVMDILTTMVTAHGIYADCLYAHIYNQGA
ncbi:MAG: lipase family protein [Planctomycetota bacterium]